VWTIATRIEEPTEEERLARLARLHARQKHDAPTGEAGGGIGSTEAD
jgi:hypothetical protein